MTDHHADIPSSSSSPDDKATLRARMKADLRAATPAFHAHASETICESLIAFIAERIPSRLGVMVYAPMPRAGEVDITAAIRQLLGDDRPVLLPSLDWQARTMRPVRIRDWDTDLIPDRLNERLGLRVPREETTPSPSSPPFPLAHLGAVIVPGLAFDRTGARLGRGGGFYDRFFSSPPSLASTASQSAAPTPIRLAVAFHHQLLPADALPTEPHDTPMDALITEQETCFFSPRLGGTQST